MAEYAKIRIENLSKSWGKVTAIKDMNLAIEEGDFITLLGPSGCGKTTTLRSIAGLEEPTNGKIYLNGKLVFSKKEEIVVAPSKRNLGLVFQSYALWPHMTVFENIAFGLKIKKLPKDEIKRMVLSILRDVKLEGYQDRYPQELSGGQQQRIAIARMIINRPDIYLMDEPLSNLDAKLRVDMRAELKELHQRSGATTVYVTHDQVEAMTMSSRICIMKDGIIHQVGSPEEVYRKPVNLFVADFISNPKMNFFRGKVSSLNNKTVINAAGFKLKINPEVLGREENVMVAIRPEDFFITDNGVEYTIVNQLPAGSSSIVMVERGEDKISLLFEGHFKAVTGTKIRLGIKEDLFNLFNLKTGKRIY
ncbi:MAG: ABC transporter ATP-binding protein [Spirochaetales bacterium]|nr:ABC transporter ATP-binding protein [Spirochaetales bacterium]